MGFRVGFFYGVLPMGLLVVTWYRYCMGFLVG